MSYRCDYCHKGVEHGKAVSHAKNRTHRLFKPNLQKLKVMKDGMVIRVKFCTTCIKRLKKYGKLGGFGIARQLAREVIKIPESITRMVESEKAGKKEKARETLDIASIVGKKS